MNSVSIYDLKRNLARWTQKAAKGEEIHVTRHNRPYVVLGPEKPLGVRWGRDVGKLPLEPALKGGTGGFSLRCLQEDRDGEKA